MSPGYACLKYYNASNLELLRISLSVALYSIQAFLSTAYLLELHLRVARYKDQQNSFCTCLFASVKPLPSPIGKGGDRDQYRRCGS